MVTDIFIASSDCIFVVEQSPKYTSVHLNILAFTTCVAVEIPTGSSCELLLITHIVRLLRSFQIKLLFFKIFGNILWIFFTTRSVILTTVHCQPERAANGTGDCQWNGALQAVQCVTLSWRLQRNGRTKRAPTSVSISVSVSVSNSVRFGLSLGSKSPEPKFPGAEIGTGRRIKN